MNRLLITILFTTILVSCSNENEENSFDWENDGVKIKKGGAIAYFPKDSINEVRMNEIVDSLNLGIDSARNFMGGPYKWQVFGERPITYYFEPGKFVSFTDVKGDVYIPIFRIKNYKAPWMHETIHSLLRTKKGNWNEVSQIRTFFSMPIWFTEGMAEYLAIKIEAVDSIKKFDLMRFGGYAKVDSSCKKALALNSDLISDIGESGVPIKLITDRKEYAPPFYTCSCSFVKYLAEKYGLNVMLNANSEFQNEHETIELLTGKKLETLKEEWLATLK